MPVRELPKRNEPALALCFSVVYRSAAVLARLTSYLLLTTRPAPPLTHSRTIHTHTLTHSLSPLPLPHLPLAHTSSPHTHLDEAACPGGPRLATAGLRAKSGAASHAESCDASDGRRVGRDSSERARDLAISPLDCRLRSGQATATAWANPAGCRWATSGKYGSRVSERYMNRENEGERERKTVQRKRQRKRTRKRERKRARKKTERER